jgi:hypothetical protein
VLFSHRARVLCRKVDVLLLAARTAKFKYDVIPCHISNSLQNYVFVLTFNFNKFSQMAP